MGNMLDGALETPLQVFPRATGAPERLQGRRSRSTRVRRQAPRGGDTARPCVTSLPDWLRGSFMAERGTG